jgi:23S rRNA pseudouridine955/2504/2580 synthase
MKNITVLFENEKLLVFNKPAGLPVQGGAGVKVSLDSLLEDMYKDKSDERPLLVHRLDKDTSGVIVTAKTKKSAALCSSLFASPQLKKRYLALCAGMCKPNGTIEESLEIKGKEVTAKTSYRRLWHVDLPAGISMTGGTAVGIHGVRQVSLLELELATGRMHQIRRHLERIHLPILGDDKYGNFALNKRLKKTFGLKKLLLHAVSIQLPDSLVKGGIEIIAPLPDYFTSILRTLGLNDTDEVFKALR